MILQLAKGRMEAIDHIAGDRPGLFEIVSVGRLIARANHLHPKFTIGDQAILKGQASSIARSHNCGDSLVGEIVLQQIPGELMGEFKPLNKSLLL